MDRLFLKTMNRIQHPFIKTTLSDFVFSKVLHTSATAAIRHARRSTDTYIEPDRKVDIPYSEHNSRIDVICNEDVNIDDIFGIDSDEGALCFENAVPKLDKFKSLTESKAKSDEVLHRTSFGYVRMDSENLPKNKRRSNQEETFAENSLENLYDTRLSRSVENDNHMMEDTVQNDSEKRWTMDKLKNISRNVKSLARSTTYSQQLSSKSYLKNEHDRENFLYTMKNVVRSNLHQNIDSISSHNDLTKSHDHDDKIWDQLGHFDTDITLNRPNKVDAFTSNAADESDFNNSTHDMTKETSKSRKVIDTDLSEIDEQYFRQSSNSVDDSLKTIDFVNKSNNSLSVKKKMTLNTSSNHKNSEFNFSGVDESLLGSNQSLLGMSDINENGKPKSMNNQILSHSSRENDLSEIDLQYFANNNYSLSNTCMPKPEQSKKNSDVNKVAMDISEKYQNDVKTFQTIGKYQRETEDNICHESNEEFSSLTANLNEIEKSKSRDETTKDIKKSREKNVTKYKGEVNKEEEIKLDSKGFRILTNQVLNLSLLSRADLMAELKTRVLYSDDDIMVLDKPYNLVMHEAKTNANPDLSSLLDEFASMMDPKSISPKLHIVHRLDKTTTGCVLLAKNEMSAQHLKSLFAQRKISKTYWIVTSGVPELLEGVIDIPITDGTVGKKSRMVLCPDLPENISYRPHCKRGKKATTSYCVIATSGNAALIEAKAETGLKHQIRVHFGLGLGCPIIGDHKYSYLDKLVPQKLPSDLLQRLGVRQSKVRYIPMHIHARSIVIPNYLDSKNLFVNAPLPDHMRRNLKSLKFKKK